MNEQHIADMLVLLMLILWYDDVGGVVTVCVVVIGVCVCVVFVVVDVVVDGGVIVVVVCVFDGGVVDVIVHVIRFVIAVDDVGGVG